MPYIVEKRQVTKWVPGRYETYVAVPAHYDYSTSPGWNAGAHSLVWLQQPPPGYEGITARYTFKARKESLGIFVGLAFDDAGTSPSDVLAGVYLSMGQWRPVRDGEKLSGGGAFNDGTLFTLDLTPTGLQISTADASEFVPYIMPSAVCLDAALYLKDDEILSADVACGGGQLGVLAHLQGLASNGPIGHANSVLAPVVGRAGIYEGCAGVLAPLGGVAWTGAGLGLGVLAPMQGEGTGSATDGIAFQQSVLAPVDGICIVRSGYSGQQHSGTLAPIYDAWAYGGFGRALSGQPDGMLSQVVGVAYGDDEGNYQATIFSSALGRTPTIAQPRIQIHINAHGRVIASIDSKPIGVLEGMSGAATLHSTMEAVMCLGAQMQGAASMHFAFDVTVLTDIQIESAGQTRSGLEAMLLLAETIASQGQGTSGVDAGSLLTAQLIAHAVVSGAISSNADLIAFLDAAINTRAGLFENTQGPGGNPTPPSMVDTHDGTGDYDDGHYVWVTNVKTGAVSRYTHYGFQSFAQIGGHYFGVSVDGVYLLEGDKDGDDAVHARIGTGLLGLGSKELKHVSAVYLDVASTGVMSVRVSAGDQQYTYKARGANARNAQQRVDVGRGLRANFYGFEVFNDGADFELDGLDANATKSARRI